MSRVHRTAAGGRAFSHALAASTWATAEALRTRPPDESDEQFAVRRQALLTEEVVRQSDLFRDVFGNPFRPVTCSPEWRTDTAALLARQMYDSRDFSAMPILADALQDAGCDSDDILAHCRDPHATHVRGCWVVDLVLGKE